MICASPVSTSLMYPKLIVMHQYREIALQKKLPKYSHRDKWPENVVQGIILVEKYKSYTPVRRCSAPGVNLSYDIIIKTADAEMNVVERLPQSIFSYEDTWSLLVIYEVKCLKKKQNKRNTELQWKPPPA